MRKMILIIFHIIIIFFISTGCKVIINPTPEIVVKYEDVVIPSSIGTIDFKDVLLDEEVIFELVIENTGNGILNLTGSPDLIKMTDPTVTEFAINQSVTDSKLKKNESTTFYLTYKPKSLGEHRAVIEIESNDVDYEPYVVNILGRGVLPEINVKLEDEDIESGTGICDFGVISVWDTTPEKTFTIENLGTYNLLLSNSSPIISITGQNPTMFIVNETQTESTIVPDGVTTFTVAFHPTRLGDKEAVLEIYNNDTDENPYIINLKGYGADPDINVINFERTDIPNKTGLFDFGDVIITKTKTFDFWIQNLGFYDLEMKGNPDVEITGADKEAFTVTWQPLTKIVAKSESLFKIEFHPTEVRTYTATVLMWNSDFDENPYTFTIIGRGTDPEIEITDSNSNNIDDTTGSFDFGIVYLHQSKTETFTINNTGSHVLELTGTPLVKINEDYSDVFEITSDPTASIQPGQSTTFEITFSPLEYGVYVVFIEIQSNDLDETVFTFKVIGTGAGPEISVQDSKANDIAHNEGSYDFGSMVGTNQKSEVFTILNEGSANLNLSGSPIVTISGSGSSAFAVLSQPTTPVAKQNSTTFEIEFHPSSTQEYEATVTINNDDTDESPFTFTVYGICTSLAEPEINIKQESMNIRCNTGVHDFGPIANGFSTSDVVFTIENLGSADLSLTGANLIEISGTHASEFILDYSMTANSVSAGNSTTFIIRFSPTSTGSKTATISIANDDTTENPYTFEIIASCFQYLQGDINGDGICDLAIGAPSFSFVYNESGVVYVYFGKSNLPSSLSVNDADVQFKGTEPRNYVGLSFTSAGDVNKDGYHDMIITAKNYKVGSDYNGGIFIFFGRPLWRNSYDLTEADVIIVGNDNNDAFGSCVSSGGDVNGDGIDDVVVGAVHDDDGGNYSGCVFVFFGKKTWLNNYAASDADVKIAGEHGSYYIGYSSNSEGDINNDGIADVVFGCDYNGRNSVFIFWGRQSWAPNLDTSDASLKIEASTTKNIKNCSFASGDDVNGDGIDDLVVGAQNDYQNHYTTGGAYIFFGKSSWATTIKSNDADCILAGETHEDYFGCDVKIVKDFNRDGHNDILVGANHVEDYAVRGGCAYLFYGSSSWSGTINAVHANMKFYGDESEARFGYSANSCDLNNDTYADLIIGAIYAENGSNVKAGAVYVYDGATTTPIPKHMIADASIKIEGDQSYEEFGISTSCGD